MPILDAADTPPNRSRRGLPAVVLAAMLLVLTVVAIESTFGMVHIRNYSVSGPRTRTSGSGKMRVVFDCAGYQLWLRQDPPESTGHRLRNDRWGEIAPNFPEFGEILGLCAPEAPDTVPPRIKPPFRNRSGFIWHPKDESRPRSDPHGWT